MRRFLIAINPLRWISWGGFWIGKAAMGLLKWLVWFIPGVALFFLPLAFGAMSAAAVYGLAEPNVNSTVVFLIGAATFVFLALATAAGVYGFMMGVTQATQYDDIYEVRDFHDRHGQPGQIEEPRDQLSSFWTGIPLCTCEGFSYHTDEHYDRHLMLIRTFKPDMLVVTNGSEPTEREATALYECPDTGLRFYRCTNLKYDRTEYARDGLFVTKMMYDIDEEAGFCHCGEHDRLGPYFDFEDHLESMKVYRPTRLLDPDPDKVTEFYLDADGTWECPNTGKRFYRTADVTRTAPYAFFVSCDDYRLASYRSDSEA